MKQGSENLKVWACFSLSKFKLIKLFLSPLNTLVWKHHLNCVIFLQIFINKVVTARIIITAHDEFEPVTLSRQEHVVVGLIKPSSSSCDALHA